MGAVKESQSWTATGYIKNASFVPAYGAPLLDILKPQAGERILDLGCGDGVLTVKLVEAGADVVGVDASQDMLNKAVERGLTVHHMDGQALTFESEFDAVFTNAALHWMKDPDAVVQGVKRALKPGGRFVGEFGGHTNVAALVTALLAALDKIGIDGRTKNPWYFPTPAAYQKRLEAHGFEVEKIALVPRPTPLPTGVEGWFATFANAFLDGVTDDQKSVVLKDAIALVKPSLCDDEGNWTADYVRLRFAAHLK
ncbi:MAG: class I SAM-dependent methyltransferase [Pseudomonadota bacterium]